MNKLTLPHDEDFEKIESFVQSGAEHRTIAIVCATYCERYVAKMIATKLPALTPELRAELFQPTGPLGPAVTRYKLAFAMGLLGDRLFHDLKMLAKIRNIFAHELDVKDAHDPRIADRVKCFKSALQPSEDTPEKWIEEKLHPLDNEGLFIYHMVLFPIHLRGRMGEIEGN